MTFIIWGRSNTSGKELRDEITELLFQYNSKIVTTNRKFKKTIRGLGWGIIWERKIWAVKVWINEENNFVCQGDEGKREKKSNKDLINNNK